MRPHLRYDPSIIKDSWNALCGYSYLHKLKREYFGPAFRVRRSDNAELDIYFNGLEVDTASLLTFCTGVDGFIVTEYDQIANFYHATQSTAANQKVAVLAGALVTSPSGVFEPRFDCSNDSIYATLPNNRTLNVAFGSWSDCQNYEIITQSSGVTYLPAGSSGLQGVSCSEMVYFQGPVPSQYMDRLRSICMSDLHADDLFRLRFYTAGSKTLSVTESGSGITFTTVRGTQSGTFSESVDAFDWLVVRATNPSRITVINWNSKQIYTQINSAMFAKLTELRQLYLYINQITGRPFGFESNPELTEISTYSNNQTGSINSLKLNTELTVYYNNLNKISNCIVETISINLGNFRLDSNLLTQSAVDALLAAFVAAGKNSGTRVLNLGGTGNATPSATGLADKATLVSRGWTVTTN